MSRFLKVSVVCALLFSLLPVLSAQAAIAPPGTVQKQFQVSPGVSYSKSSYTSSGLYQSMNILDINTADPYTQVEVGIPNPLDKLMTVTSKANSNTYNGHRVVGAINGSFFDMYSRMPLYLIAKDNALYNAGVVSEGSDKYVSEPIAFGVTADGKNEIDYFNLNMRVQFQNQNFPLSGMNRIRNNEELILYTPSHENGYTNTNRYGIEYVIVTDQAKINEPLKFGDKLTGKIQAIRSYGDTTNTKIPANGFVLSYNGKVWGDRLQGLTVGDEVSVSLSIDAKWMNAKYILASGPMLVKDGKPFITMDENSFRAAERHPRSAVAIDSTKNRVFFVTVDGRKQGGSNGMTIREFAEYLVKMGADRALNLDGGGSTAIAVRNYGQDQVSLANLPSDGTQRSVSTILQAVSTAPLGQPTIIRTYKKQEGKLLAGSSLQVGIDYILDQYFNNIPINQSNLSISTTNDIAAVTGLNVTGAKKGEGKIVVKYGTAVKELPLTVIDTLSRFTINEGNQSLNIGQSIKLSTSGLDAENQPVIYDKNKVEWSVTSEIGSISADGVFKAAQAGSGKVTAKYGNNTASISVTVIDNTPKDTLILDNFEDTANWLSQTARANAVISKSVSPNPVKHEKAALKLDYDFSAGEAGTAAAYVAPAKPIITVAVPKKIGVWVYGDAKNHWLRGKITDSAGISYTINFTEEGKLNWNGWKYVEAAVPNTATGNITVQQIYVAEAVAEKQGKGTLYFDKLQAVYSDSYVERMFNDVNSAYWAMKEIEYLAGQGIISGYPNGEFEPGAKLTRAHAAILLARALKLNTSNVANPGFTDVPTTHRYYSIIAAVENQGIMNGKGDGTFDPEGNLTRAQMAVILTNAYSLTGMRDKDFSDVEKDYWAYKQIHALAANNVTTGYPDNTYKPGDTVTRAQYSAFLYRILAN
ncbi:S-layer homology domain-containing protein [Cytobacillus oceanisediminis]|uniref:S-layer homology domain-containing protein n=1 Tax=Cytobacillus oceanisediminis TaxID=665099 RepID=UPI0037352152